MGTSADHLLERVRSATAEEYSIIGELGRGGMAAVYLARDLALERRVAIKVMLPDLVNVGGIKDRFVIEAKTAAHLDHPGIVTVYSVKQREDLLFIVMKYIEGRTLEGVLRDGGRMDHGVATAIVTQVAEALYFAHGEGIIHRDVKPSNIIIDTRGRPVVTDFGIAKITAERSITVTGSVIGTPTYMSPEQCRGLQATAASDQYSLGVMLYEMLARTLPFNGSLFELIHAHCEMPPPPLHEMAPTVDPALEETVMRMLAKNPRDRWPSLADVVRALTPTTLPPRRSAQVRATIAALARHDDRTFQLPSARPGHPETHPTTPSPNFVVTPADPALEIGETIQLRVSESSGASLQGIVIRWTSEDPSVATVDHRGLVTGRSNGLAKITAGGGGSVGRATVTVRAARVDVLAVTPQNPRLEVGEEMSLLAIALDARGQTLAGQQIVWTSSDVKVCVVSQQGRAIAIAPGRATINARCGSVHGAAAVEVALPAVERVEVEPPDVTLEAHESVRLTASALASGGRRLTDRPITWRSTAAAIATVDAEGTVRSAAPGTASIIVACDGVETTVPVTVRQAALVAVRIQPARLPQVEVGRSMQLSAAGEDRHGHRVPTETLRWRSEDDGIALVDASGKVHGLREGRTRVVALAGDVESAIDVTVVGRPVTQLRIEPHPPTLAVGEFLALEAVALDSDGGVLEGRDITWTSSDAGVVAVDSVGVCEAKKRGAVRISAAVGTVKTTTKLSATVSPVAAAMAGAAIATGETEGAVDATGARTMAGSTPTPPRAPGRSRRAVLVVAGVVAIVGLAAVGKMMTGGETTDGGSAATAPGPDTPTDTSALGASAPPITTAVADTTAAAAARSGNPAAPLDPRGGGARSSGQPALSGRSTVAQATVPAGRGADTVGRGRSPRGAQAAPPPASGSAAAGGGRAADPVTPPTTPVRDPVPPPVTTTPARTDTSPQRAQSPPPAVGGRSGTASSTGRAAGADPDATRAVLCGDPTTPTTLLNQTLSSDPATKLLALYQPRDRADTEARDAMQSYLRGLNGLRATARALNTEPVADGCAWIVTVEFNGVSFVGAPRRRSYTIRAQLEMDGATPRVRRVYGATGG